MFCFSCGALWSVAPALTLDALPLQLWTPPTPPQDDNDIYIDSVMMLMYEATPMPESKLPPVYVRKEHKRLKMDPSGERPVVELPARSLSRIWIHFCSQRLIFFFQFPRGEVDINPYVQIDIKPLPLKRGQYVF